MGLRPETRYAKSGDVHIAYQISGAGPRDLVLASGFVSHLELDWDRPAAAHVFERLGKFARLIRFDPEERRKFVTLRRMSASPGAALAIARMNTEIDVRHVLPVIRVPTLILHRAKDRDVTVENGRYLAEHIAGARYVEFAKGDHRGVASGEFDPELDEVEEFVTGVRPGAAVDRVLSTVLFTDIVGSTERLVTLGDRKWQELKAAHHRIVRAELARLRGREVDAAGDGFFATFDGPARAVRCAAAIRAAVRQLGLDIRAGVHTGEVETSEEGVTGLAVHIGARVMGLAGAGEILATSTVKDLVAGSGIEFEDRGVRAFKGVPTEWRVFVVVN